jgi:hypothetical protein
MFDNVWLVLPRTKDLVSPYQLYPASRPIKASQPFTVSLVSVVVAEDLDGFLRGKNDVLVLTKSAIGEKPLVQRIHFYEEEVPKGRPIRNMFADSVFVTDDYSGSDRLWLELNVLEVDTDTGERNAAVNAFRSLSSTAGAVFPAIVPYTFAAGAAVTLIEKLVSVLEKDENVVKVRFALHPGEPRIGKAPLQGGTYVVFAVPQDSSKFKLQPNGLLTPSNKPSEVSYVVFDIAPQKTISGSFVMNQKVATLLTQLQSGNSNSAKSTIEFLNETLTEYSNFKKLQRYLELKSKQDLTPQEKELMVEIGKIKDLKPFLPKN